MPALFAVATLALTACGGDDGDGDDGTGGGDVGVDAGSADTPDGDAGPLSNAEFCERIEAMEAELDGMSQDEADAAFLGEVEELIPLAPSDEIREAMITLTDLFRQLEDLNEEDPEAMQEAFELMDDPEILAASETLDAFGVEECGFEPSE